MRERSLEDGASRNESATGDHSLWEQGMSGSGAKPRDLYEFLAADSDADLSTQVIHNGESPYASAFPIYQANTVEGIYIRMRNPTVEALEEKMRSLEGGAATVALGSGMAAVSHTLLGLLGAGDRIVVHRAVFIGVQTLLKDYVSKLGIEVSHIDLNSREDLARALEKPTRLVYFETLSNPGLEVVDAPAVIQAARQAGSWVVIDNTLLTPYLFKPLESGADVVIHSATKYLSGHGDVLAGLATFNDAEMAKSVHKARRILGGLLSPLGAFLVMRGMKTLPLRMKRHCQNAHEVAQFLEQHPRVKAVHYPGLPRGLSHDRAKSFLSGFGGIVSFEPGDPALWESFSKRLRLCQPGMSFGDAATRVQQEGPIRLAVGLEDPGDIIRDLEQALDE
jgi:methionine-gamma-lyase